jgi:hypothetical protein
MPVDPGTGLPKPDDAKDEPKRKTVLGGVPVGAESNRSEPNLARQSITPGSEENGEECRGRGTEG